MSTNLCILACRSNETPHTLVGLNDIQGGGSHLPALTSCLHRRFEAQTRRRSEAVALLHGEQSVSYGELNARANRVAHRLRRMGVGPDMPVGLCMDRSVDMLVGLLGILKAGGAYLPLDPSYPKERLTFMAQDARVVALVSHQSIDYALGNGRDIPILLLDADSSSLASERDDDPESGVTETNVAYIIYTSGSTGMPKGVMITHANVTRLFDTTQDWFHFGESDIWTLFHSFAFDFSVWEIWGALLYGGRLVVVPFWVSRSPEAFLDLLSGRHVTVLNQTPSAFRQLMAADQASGGIASLSLRLVIFGGEALDFACLKGWFDRRGDRRPQLINMYGITETTIHVTYRPLTASEAERSQGSLIGGPIPDLQLHLLNAQLQPVPVGVPGEIYVGGAGLARGYLGRPELTAEKLIPDPHGKHPGVRLYCSGDLARRLPTGELEYLGRIDDQVKLRGFRVETGEIESALLQHPGVREAVVRTYSPSALDDVRLVAYVVPDPQQAASVGQLLHLERQGKLADHTLYELPNGMTIAHLGQSETDFVYKEVFENDTYLRHGVHLAPGDCVFDVGANIGLSALFFATRCPELTLYVFEPLRAVFDVLQLNMEIHNVNARAFPCGLSDQPGTAEFSYFPHCSVISGQVADATAERETAKIFLRNEQRLVGSANLAVDGARLASESHTCELRTLSDVIRDCGVQRIDLLKIDVEKGEERVVQGMADEDWAKVRQAVIVVHDIDGRLTRIRTLLKSRGFLVQLDQETRLAGSSLFNVYAVRPGSPSNGVSTRASAAGASPPRWSSKRALAADLRTHLQKKLPEHMVPASFTFVESIPLTINGKLDAAALPPPEALGSSNQVGTFEAPRTAIEKRLTEIWAEVLGVRRVGLQDNFLDLGGHSLLATQLAVRMTTAFGIEIPLRAIFEYPTVALLANYIEMIRWAVKASRQAAADAGNLEEGEL